MRTRKKSQKVSNKDLRKLELEDKNKVISAVETVAEVIEEVAPEASPVIEALELRAIKRAGRMAGKPRNQVALILMSDPDVKYGGIPRVGITRTDKEESKSAKKQAKLSRKINRQRANKKSRPTGSKRRK